MKTTTVHIVISLGSCYPAAEVVVAGTVAVAALVVKVVLMVINNKSRG